MCGDQGVCIPTHGKCMCDKVKGKSMEEDAFSSHVVANNMNKFRNKLKVVADIKSSSSSNDKISKERIFSCSSCPRKFSCQQALAGHRNTHKSEWESLLDLPDHVAANDMNKISNKEKTVAVCNSSSSLNNDISEEKVFSCSSCPCKFSSQQTLASLLGPSVPASQHIINSANTLLGPSIGVPHKYFFGLKNKLHMLSNGDTIHPLDNGMKAQGKSALGVRCESMIPKLCQGRQLGHTDLSLRVGSASFGKKQITGGNIMRYGSNNRKAELKSLLTAAVSDSLSRSDGGINIKAHDLLSYSFQPKDGRRIETHDFFLVTSAQVRRNYDTDHSPQGLRLQLNQNRVDVDLDLKL